MPMSSQERVLDLILYTGRQCSRTDHVIAHEIGHHLQILGLHVQHHAAIDQQATQLEQGVQGERGHVRLRPSIATLLHILLEFDPSRCLLPLDLVALLDQHPHFRKQGMRYVCAIVHILAKYELNSLCRRSHYKFKDTLWETEGLYMDKK